MIHVEKTNEGYLLDDFRGAGPTIAAATYVARSEDELKEILKGFGASDRDMTRVVRQVNENGNVTTSLRVVTVF